MRHWVSKHRLLLLAIIAALAYHGGMVFFTFPRTYDAYVHIFFADHWQRAWFDHWEYRWYTGFPMVSYPPGSQMSVALIGYLVGLTTGFGLVQILAVINCTIGIYRFSRILVSREAAGYAAILFVFSSSITETIHVFGQLPTIFSLGFLLNTIPFMYRFLQKGEIKYLLIAWIWNAATTAGHHVTTLFGAAFFLAPVMVMAIIEKFREPLADEPEFQPLHISSANLRALVIRRLRRIVPVVMRCGIYGVGMIALLVIVVLPYWIWSVSDPINQVSIPHASRDSFIENTAAGLVFWVIPWGMALIAYPYAVYKGLTTRAWPLTLSLLLLTLLGTGGTTPIPRLLLGGAYEVLTLDRFTFWATIIILPLLGEFVASLVDGRLAHYVNGQFGGGTWRALQFGLVLAYVGFSLFTANLTRLRKFQPEPIDMDPIVRFIEKDKHYLWRYLTLGFGDQVAWLGAQTTATSVDGNYHSARRLPELTTTPVERLEGAKFRGIPGIGSLQQFLAVPDKYNLKFIFSNDQFYDPLLYFSGWHRLGQLENGIMVWEREDIPPLPEVLPRKEIPLYQRAMWGILPMTTIFLALLASSTFVWGSGAVAIFRLIGVIGFLEKGVDKLTAPPVRLYRWVDHLLRRWSTLPEGDSGPKLRWLKWFDRVSEFNIPESAEPSAQLVRTLLLSTAIVMVGGAGIFLWQRPMTPEAVVVAYYDDLDFRRFGDAFGRLDPQTRPDFEHYILDLTAVGGLLASYAKLDAIHTTVIYEEPERMIIEVGLRWITALNHYNSTSEIELVKRHNNWFILPEPLDPTVPAEQFIRQPALAWHLQGISTTEESAVPDNIPDRPELKILSARLVTHDDRVSVVGELINLDVDPGDTTVTAYLYDRDGELITWYNAQQVMMHKLLPKEVTPFRIDFEGVAGQAFEPVGEFDPNDFTPLQLQAPIEAFAVYAKAVITQHDLYRGVGVTNVAYCPTAPGESTSSSFLPDHSESCPPAGDRPFLRGQLSNRGTQEAIIPQLLITYYDDTGAVAWVDHHYVEESIRPQHEISVVMPLTPAGEVLVIKDGGATYSNHVNGVVSAGDNPARWTDQGLRLPLPPGSGYGAVKIQVNAFVVER